MTCLSRGKEHPYKCIKFAKESIELPSGLSLRYPNLEGVADNKGRIQWQYGGDDKNKPKKLYGGKIVENVVQAVARCVMTDQMLKIQKRYPIVLTVHDECCMLVPESEGEEAFAFVEGVMRTPPAWLPGLPLDCEGGYGKRYGDIK